MINRAYQDGHQTIPRPGLLDLSRGSMPESPSASASSFLLYPSSQNILVLCCRSLDDRKYPHKRS